MQPVRSFLDPFQPLRVDAVVDCSVVDAEISISRLSDAGAIAFTPGNGFISHQRRGQPSFKSRIAGVSVGCQAGWKSGLARLQMVVCEGIPHRLSFRLSGLESEWVPMSNLTGALAL